MGWLKYLSKDPYDNPIDPETGLPKQASFLQEIGHPDESHQLARERVAYQQIAKTSPTLASNPAYDPAGIDPWGSDNPYQAPTNRQSIYRPELTRQYQQYQNAPYEQDLARQNRESVWSETQAHHPTVESWRQQSARNDIPINAEQAAATHKALEDQKLTQATSEIERVRGTIAWDTMMPSWVKETPSDELAILVNSNPSLVNMLSQVSAGAGLKSNIAELHAVEQAALSQKNTLDYEKEKDELDLKHSMLRSGYEAKGRELASGNKLGLPEAQANQANFEARTGLSLGSAYQSPFFSDISTGQYQANPNAQYRSPWAIAEREKMDFANSFQNQARGSVLGARGITPNVRPAMGFSGDSLSTSARLPVSLQQGPPTPVATQVTAPEDSSITSKIVQGVLENTTEPVRKAYHTMMWPYENIHKPFYKSIYNKLKKSPTNE